jgi:flagellar basal-body rod modification protein FlgD
MMSTTISNVASGLGNVSGTSTSTATGSTANIGKDDFMKLLLAQLKNQDPLKPMEGTEFAVQLAQFSSLEQLSNMNTELKNQGLNQMTLGYAQSVNMIGKEVIAQKGNTIHVDGAATDVNYQLANDASTVTVSIFDENGKLIKKIEETGKESGLNKTTWDSSSVPAGNYSFQIAASDITGKNVPADTLVSGLVTAAHFKNNNISLTVNGQELALSDVVSIKQTK